MKRKPTGFKDVRGDEIFVLDDVFYKGDLYEVIVNDFSGEIVLDNECGMVKLSEVYQECAKA